MKWWVVPLFALIVFGARNAAAQQARAARTGVGVGAEATTTGIVEARSCTTLRCSTSTCCSAATSTQLLHGRRRGRFFFPLHTSQSADFSIGPGVGIVHTNNHPGAPNPDTTVNEGHVEARFRSARSSSRTSHCRHRQESGSYSRTAATGA